MPMADDSQFGNSLRTVTSKSVLIAEPETITPEPSPALAPLDNEYHQFSSSPKQHRTSAFRRLSGRLPEKHSPSLHSIPSLTSLKSIPTIDPPGTDPNDKETSIGSHHHGPEQHGAIHVISQVAEWLEQEQARRASLRSRKSGNHAETAPATDATSALADRSRTEEVKHRKRHHTRRDSDLSESGLALEKLEKILSESMHVKDHRTAQAEEKKDSYFPRRRSLRKESSRKLMRRNSTAFSSDSEYPDNDLFVPSAEVILDNSKTLKYSGGATISDLDLTNVSKSATKDRDAWKHFKSEIVTLTHTLKISGWRRVPIDRSEEIDVERLCGALTNAVYVVSPPNILPQTPAISRVDAPLVVPKKRPPKLLLRIYGPQVEHLIDRENELQILRRLGRRNIGPKLLGTFMNGRFEEFFCAKTLTAADLRVPETSKQIAKRMRELHDGIDLLKEEREGGPCIWKKWDKWVDRCDEITRWLDHQVLSSATQEGQLKPHSSDWKMRGLICGVEWPVFRRTVDTYRAWLLHQYDGDETYSTISKSLVFAHNDTQYGNLLRLEPSGESPLLLPANEHKQLVVIDFEYASANTRGLEFANHFTEWCYNYHSRTASHTLNEKNYPTIEEQNRFLKAYLQHRPPSQQSRGSNPNHSSSTHRLSPAIVPSQGTPVGGSISSFMLDSRAPPPPGGYQEEERQREEALQREIERLKRETQLWRVANSAQWVAWGIVQAKVEGMDKALDAAPDVDPERGCQVTGSDPLSAELKPLADAAKDKHPVERETFVPVQHTSSGATTEESRDAQSEWKNDARDGGKGLPPSTAAKEEEREAKAKAEAESGGEEGEEDEEEEFDYLGYAQQRALFFWGDILQLGLVQKEDLPREMWENIKIVEY